MNNKKIIKIPKIIIKKTKKPTKKIRKKTLIFFCDESLVSRFTSIIVSQSISLALSLLLLSVFVFLFNTYIEKK